MDRKNMWESQWLADTKSGETLHFELCKGGYFSNKEEYGLKVVGKTLQDGTPTPDNPVSIQCVKAGTKIKVYGKNLFDVNGLAFKYNNGTTMWEVDNNNNIILPKSDGTAWTACPYMTLPTGKYTFSSEKYVKFEIRQYGSNGEFIRITENSTKLLTFDIEYPKIQVKLAKPLYISNEPEATIEYPYTVGHAQLEMGGSKTAFEPCEIFGEITTPCDLYEGDIWYPMSGKVEKYRNKIEFDGSENWSTYYRPNYTYLVGIPDKKRGNLESYCSHFENIYQCWMGYDYDNQGCFSDHSLQQNIFFTSSVYWGEARKTDNWKNYLKEMYDKGNPITVVYELEVPIIEQYYPQYIFTPKGIVNVLQEPIGLSADLEATMLCKEVV